MDFHAQTNKYTYTSRQADSNWMNLLEEILDYKQVEHALDIGCGGGIYTKALVELGIPSVTGVDSSEVMLEAALENCHGMQGVNSTRVMHRKQD